MGAEPVLDPATVAPQPWRNGRGVTRELARGEGWRLSLADLTAEGEFSLFPGTDRTLWPLSGGFELVLRPPAGEGEEATVVPTSRLEPVRFPGEARVSLRGLSARTQALNLITARGTGRGRLRLVPAHDRFSAAALVRVRLGDETVAEVHLDPPDGRGATGTTTATQREWE